MADTLWTPAAARMQEYYLGELAKARAEIDALNTRVAEVLTVVKKAKTQTAFMLCDDACTDADCVCGLRGLDIAIEYVLSNPTTARKEN